MANIIAIAVVFIPCVFVSPGIATQHGLALTIMAWVCLAVAAFKLIRRSDRVVVLSWIAVGIQLGLADTAGGLINSFQIISGHPPSYSRHAEVIRDFVLFITLPILVAGCVLTSVTLLVVPSSAYRWSARFLLVAIAIILTELVMLPVFHWHIYPFFFWHS